MPCRQLMTGLEPSDLVMRRGAQPVNSQATAAQHASRPFGPDLARGTASHENFPYDKGRSTSRYRAMAIDRHRCDGTE